MEQKSRMGRPLKAKGEKVARRLMVNLVEADYQRMMKSYDPTIHVSKAAFYRARMIDQTITVRTRNSSLDDLVPVLVKHNEELRRAGINLNQLVHHLNTFKSPVLKKEVYQLLLAIKEVTEIEKKSQAILHEINEKWSQ